eukprot:5314072-Amphidinium_carterae.2
MIYPDYKELCAVTLADDVVRVIEEPWLDRCWESNDNNHGLFQTWEHRKEAQKHIKPSQRDNDAIWRYYNKLKRAVYRHQTIDLSSSLQLYRKMMLQNDTFKIHRCIMMVKAFENQPDEEITNSLRFEGQEQCHTQTTRGERAPQGANPMLSKDNVVKPTVKEMNVMQAGQKQPDGSPDHMVAVDIQICHSIRMIGPWYRNRVAHYMDNLFHADNQAKKGYAPAQRTKMETEKYLMMVERQDAFEQKDRMQKRRFNAGHCSYFHRLFQQPICRGQGERIIRGSPAP